MGELISPTFSPGRHHGEAKEHLTYWSKQVENEDIRERLAFMDIHTHLQPRLLRDLDAMSMAHSIPRSPPVFLDHRVVEFLLPIPSSIRMRQKRLLEGRKENFSASRVAGGFQPRARSAHLPISFSALAIAGSAPCVERSVCAGPPSRHRHPGARGCKSPVGSL